MRAAASRTFCTAGSNRPMRMAMMAMTTSSSINVKPWERVQLRAMRSPLHMGERQGRPALTGTVKRSPTMGAAISRFYEEVDTGGDFWKSLQRIFSTVHGYTAFTAVTTGRTGEKVVKKAKDAKKESEE